jgi:hypothetical protein
MKTSLRIVLLVLASFALGEQFGLWLRRPIVLEPTVITHIGEAGGTLKKGPKPLFDPGAAGVVGDDQSCEEFWNTCWRRT